MIIPAGKVRQLVESYNFLNLSGLKGEGKTRFAMEIAELFLRRGYRLITNVHTVWADDPEKIEALSDGTYRIIVLLDEGGWYIRTLETISKMLVESSKMDVYWLSPSVMLPHEELWTLTCYPVLHIGGFYVWKFLSITLDSVAEKKPKKTYCIQIVSPLTQNLYQTASPGYRPTFILSLFDRLVEEFARYHNSGDYGLGDLANPSSIHSKSDQGNLSKIGLIFGSSSSGSHKGKGK